ncbi:hypothetical protein [Methylomagnum ishizawai]|uniref:hypothetical protein n=1 Tax=Methylomagnum ishizawai TaxID=1760988 RepID=UPI0020CAEA7A|nr:hypothetical protein [Methylomagnum ishizawai]
MPSLVGFTPRHSLLDETCRRVVARQIEYGRQRGIPGGISESAFAARDAGMTYQYSAFGVPGLGMKRGLARDWVVAPYATALAALYGPGRRRKLRPLGSPGRAGSAMASTKPWISPRSGWRNGKGCGGALLYGHHQGMALVALADVVHDGAMRGRFHRVPLIQATELLLHERGPRGLDTHSPRSPGPGEAAQVASRRYASDLPRHPPCPRPICSRMAVTR